jgi:hypothetical protein
MYSFFIFRCIPLFLIATSTKNVANFSEALRLEIA